MQRLSKSLRHNRGAVAAEMPAWHSMHREGIFWVWSLVRVGAAGITYRIVADIAVRHVHRQLAECIHGTNVLEMTICDFALMVHCFEVEGLQQAH